MKEIRICPVCKQPYMDRPAISRRNGADICPDCGMREALEDWLINSKGEAEKALRNDSESSEDKKGDIS